MNTARHFLHGYQWPHVLGFDHALFFFITRARHAITHSQILQLAFSALIANRTIQWMIDQEELHYRFLR